MGSGLAFALLRWLHTWTNKKCFQACLSHGPKVKLERGRSGAGATLSQLTESLSDEEQVGGKPFLIQKQG